jgi:hypothetical protein
LKNGNFIFFLALLLMGSCLMPGTLRAHDIPASVSERFSATAEHLHMSRLHELSQYSLRYKSLKNKKLHHPTSRPEDPFSIHHVRPLYVSTLQDQETQDNPNSGLALNKPLYIGTLHPSGYISKIFHPPTF